MCWKEIEIHLCTTDCNGCDSMEYYQAQSAGYFKRLGFRVGSYGKEFISLPQYHESFDDEDMIYFKTTRTLNKRMTQFINEHRDEIKAFEAQKDKEKLVQQEKKKVDQATYGTPFRSKPPLSLPPRLPLQQRQRPPQQ